MRRPVAFSPGLSLGELVATPDRPERVTAERAYTLALGWSSKPLGEQLTAQGLPFDPETMRHLELDALAASRLKTRGIVSRSVGERAYDAITKRVWAEVSRALKAAAPPAESPPPQSEPAEASASCQTRDEHLPSSPDNHSHDGKEG